MLLRAHSSPIDRLRRMATRLPTLLATLLATPLALGGLAACQAAPHSEAPKGPIPAAERVLAIDFSPAAQSRRTASLRLLLGGLAHEPARLVHATQAPSNLAHAAAASLVKLPKATGKLVHRELSQLPSLPPGLADQYSLDHFARRLADNLANLPQLLGLDHPAMGEIDDRQHRVDPHDEHPEKSFWARLRRRLRL